MMASVEFLSVIVSLALLLTLATPVILIALLIKDWKGGKQW